MTMDMPAITAVPPSRLKVLSWRANPAYRLIPYAELDSAQRALVGERSAESSLFGLLWPRPGVALPPKAVCRKTAWLLGILPERDPLARLNQPAAERMRRALAGLVLDEVISVDTGAASLTGMSALHALMPDDASWEPQTELAELSLTALQQAEQLSETAEAPQLLAYLYGFHRVPFSQWWAERFTEESGVAAVLGIEPGGANQTRLQRDWSAAGEDGSAGWFAWSARRRPYSTAQATCKLYVSPSPAYVREAFDAVVETAAAAGAHHFKIGRQPLGLLRPDKLVVYFAHLSALQQAAGHLGRMLAGCPTQGVPFTAQIGDSPLLSWGIDPPQETAFSPDDRESWRLWMVKRLASGLATARRAAIPGLEPWRACLESLRWQGICPRTWAPPADFFAPIEMQET